VAADRDQVISEGRDPSYSKVLMPALRRLGVAWLIPDSRVLDAGCGTGRFASELSIDHPQSQVVGVDPSCLSVDIARMKRPGGGNLSFRQATVESFVAQIEPHTFDLVIANMLLQNVSSLSTALNACATALARDGALVFAVPHPCFWPRYWEYESEEWFHYDREIWIEAPFRTSLSPGNGVTTTHTHRPLHQYLNAFTAAGLFLEELAEYPDSSTEAGHATAWDFPRFLLGRCRMRGDGLP
jgi:SAM-dependent methyltransferase